MFCEGIISFLMQFVLHQESRSLQKNTMSSEKKSLDIAHTTQHACKCVAFTNMYIAKNTISAKNYYECIFFNESLFSLIIIIILSLLATYGPQEYG